MACALAPFHDFDAQITPELKAAIDQLKADDRDRHASRSADYLK